MKLLGEVLENLPSCDGLVLKVLKYLSSAEQAAWPARALSEWCEEVSKIMKPLCEKLRAAGKSLLSSSKNPFLAALFAALQSQSLGNYLAMVAHNTQPIEPFQLSLDCDALQEMYIQYFRQAMPEMSLKGIEATYPIHRAMLDEASCRALFIKISERLGTHLRLESNGFRS